MQSCQKAGITPGKQHDLSGVRTLGSTGSPLAPEQFAWIAEAVGEHVQISSMSGGTDVCTAFLTSAPTVPVWLGELSCAALGADVHAVDEKGADIPLSDDPADVGELVINQPMPSMPVAFWADPDGSRLREAYYADFPGRWRHGDWLRATPRGSFVISGRSDSTLNRGGVRMGTADLYAVIEGFDEVVDSLVVDTTALGSTREGELLCFLVLADGAALDDVEPALRTALRKELSPRHVPDRFVVVDEVPRTLSGKKCEVPVKRILAGVDPEKAVSRGALRNPDALAPFLELAGRSCNAPRCGDSTGANAPASRRLLREVGRRERAEHGEGVEVGRDVAAHGPAPQLVRRPAGDQGAGEVEVRTPGAPPPRRPAEPRDTHVHVSPTSAIGGRSATRGANRPQRTARGSPARPRCPDRPARRARRAGPARG